MEYQHHPANSRQDRAAKARGAAQKLTELMRSDDVRKAELALPLSELREAALQFASSLDRPYATKEDIGIAAKEARKKLSELSALLEQIPTEEESNDAGN